MNSLKSLYFDAAEPDSQRWKMLVEKHAKRAQTFEIHCWKEEPEWIDLALQYGIPKETDWPYGTVISGPVTPEFLHMLLCLLKKSRAVSLWDLLASPWKTSLQQWNNFTLPGKHFPPYDLSAAIHTYKKGWIE